MKNIYLDSFRQNLNTWSFNEVMEGFESLQTPHFTISDVGIEHRWITHWDKYGLINLKRGESGWRRFSFLDYVWLKIIVELRTFKIPLETVKKLKEKLFTSYSQSGDNDFIWDAITSGTVPLPPGLTKDDCLEHIAAIGDAVNPFLFAVMNAIKSRDPFCMLVSLDGEFEFLDLFNPEIAPMSTEILMGLVSKKNFISVNIQFILEQFYSNKHVKNSVFESIFTLSDQEKEILARIREGDFREITIKETKDNGYILAVEKEIAAKDVEIKIKGVVVRGAYDEMRLIRENGFVAFCIRNEKIKI